MPVGYYRQRKQINEDPPFSNSTLAEQMKKRKTN
jgi:hypothetical protein